MTFNVGDRVVYAYDRSHPGNEYLQSGRREQYNGIVGTVRVVEATACRVTWDDPLYVIDGILPHNLRLIDEPVVEEDWS